MHLLRSIQQKLHPTAVSDWPTVPATIDVVTVIRQEEQKGHQEIVSYLATLRTVPVHVDPRDQANSVLLEEDLLNMPTAD